MQHHVTLINPAINSESQNPVINSVINKMIPSSLGYIAGYVREAGLSDVRIYDEQFGKLSDGEMEEIIGELAEPRIVGLSVWTLSSRRSYDICRRIKAIDPKVTVILGGIHPTVMPEEGLEQEGVDVVVRSEGEVTFSELTRLILAGESYKDVLGISINGDDGIVHNPPRPLVRDLDDFPPFPYEMFADKVKDYSSFGVVYASRGCPFKCIFCSQRSITGASYRKYSIERVVSEITRLVDDYNQTEVHISDEILAASKKRFFALADGIIEAGLHKKARFHGSLRGDQATDEILGKMKEANFSMLAYGLETGTERLMKVIDKDETVQEVVDAIHRTAKHGMDVAATIIFGLPTESRDDRRETLKLVKNLPLVSLRFNTMTPYPGTPAYEQLNPQGKVLIKDNWENFGVQYLWEGDDIPYVPDESNRYELIFDTMSANLSSYVSWSGIKRLLTASHAGGNVVKLSDRWYFSPFQVWRMFRLAFFLTRRYLYIFLRMNFDRFFRPAATVPFASSRDL